MAKPEIPRGVVERTKSSWRGSTYSDIIQNQFHLSLNHVHLGAQLQFFQVRRLGKVDKGRPKGHS